MTVLASGTKLPDWRSTRINQRYTAALRLAEIVLANASAETGAGHLQMAAFVVDMARVYEDFVATAIREALAEYPGDTRSQYAARLDENDYPGPPGIPMYVDVVHLVDGISRLVFDAKYKAADHSGQYPNADHYQMLAYCTALQVPTAWLVYAGHGPVRQRRIVHTQTTVFEYPLDLSAEPLVLLTNVNTLVAAAWQATSSPVVAPCPARAGSPKFSTRSAESKGTGDDGQWFAASDI